jgi:hypothetical protein
MVVHKKASDNMSPQVIPVALSVKPYQVSHLCFEGGGILEVSVAQLGAKVKAFDFPAFYLLMNGFPTVGGDPSRLLYSSQKIEADVSPFVLATLRKEARKAALNSAINARQNAYFAKYANSAAIISLMNQYYSTSAVGSKPQRLNDLADVSYQQWNLLSGAYADDSLDGVVKNTRSTLAWDSVNYGYSAASGIVEARDVSVGGNPTGTVDAPPDPPPPWPFPDSLPTYNPAPPQAPSDTWVAQFPTDGTATHTIQKGTNYQTVSRGDRGFQSQTIINTDYGYKTPYHEARAQYERAQISLMDQRFAQFMYGQNLPNLDTVFQNELNSIDSNVFRLQIAFLNTILMSPIPGTVTGIYKNPGDAVRPGEPIVRIEDNSTIFILATIIYRGPIAIGSNVTVQTPLFDSSGPPTSIAGSVVSARGHRDDDKWDLVVKCDNIDGSGNPIFPLGYHFDYDNTTVSIN